MTVRELLDVAANEVWITTAETPIHSTPEIRVRSMTDREEKEMTDKDKLFLKDILKPIRRMPPLQDTYSARHLPFGRLTAYGQRKKEEEQKHEGL